VRSNRGAGRGAWRLAAQANERPRSARVRTASILLACPSSRRRPCPLRCALAASPARDGRATRDSDRRCRVSKTVRVTFQILAMKQLQRHIRTMPLAVNPRAVGLGTVLRRAHAREQPPLQIFVVDPESLPTSAPPMLLVREPDSPHQRSPRPTSRWRLPVSHARLASGCASRPWPGGVSPAGIQREVSAACSAHGILLTQAWPGASRMPEKIEKDLASSSRGATRPPPRICLSSKGAGSASRRNRAAKAAASTRSARVRFAPRRSGRKLKRARAVSRSSRRR
jgi:hypothetical protein